MELRFNIGDKARVVGVGTHGFEIDEVIIIKDFADEDSNYDYIAENGLDYWWMKDSDLAPIPRTTHSGNQF